MGGDKNLVSIARRKKKIAEEGRRLPRSVVGKKWCFFQKGVGKKKLVRTVKQRTSYL